MEASTSNIQIKATDDPKQPEPRKTRRATTGKSRSGCRQCKLRRLKCDETRPGCRNCAKKGLQCPGYAKEIRWSSKHEHHLEPESSCDTASTPSVKESVSPVSGVCTPEDQSIGASGAETAVATIPKDSVFFNAPIDLQSTLVEYWFRSICPLWSTFDSDISYNRKLPLSTWTSSEPVYFALQAMSAAYLADSLPQLNSMLPSLINQTTSAIAKRMATLRNSPNIPTVNITIDLLFAVFAMGTSMHWTDAAQFDDRLLQYASEILGLWELNLSSVDALVHAYFHQALVHWRMLLILADRNVGGHVADRTWITDQARPRQVTNMRKNSAPLNPPQLWHLSSTLKGAGPHSWCGVSSEVIDIFGQVVALCRMYRNPETTETSEEPSTIGLAWDLQQHLLGMDFDLKITMNEMEGVQMSTGDEKTPISHLIMTAEAYRYASLLQLHITFESLDFKRPNKKHESIKAVVVEDSFSETATHEEKLVLLALQLIAILETIPGDSGARCNQPPLLILAAAGLRLKNRASNPPGSAASGHVISSVSGSTSGMSPSEMDRLLASIRQSTGDYTDVAGLMNPTITGANFEVSKARRFVKSRLHVLHGTLPPKPISCALDLVDAIWRAYDDTWSGSHDVHWLDVMNSTGLKTIFS